MKEVKHKKYIMKNVFNMSWKYKNRQKLSVLLEVSIMVTVGGEKT